MMARGTKGSKPRPDTLMQDRTSPTRRAFLQRTAGPYIWVIHVEPKQPAVLPDVRFTSNSVQASAEEGIDAMCHKRTYAVQRVALYSITWSARVRSVAGTGADTSRQPLLMTPQHV
jgi:hypothetical protein